MGGERRADSLFSPGDLRHGGDNSVYHVGDCFDVLSADWRLGGAVLVWPL